MEINDFSERIVNYSAPNNAFHKALNILHTYIIVQSNMDSLGNIK